MPCGCGGSTRSAQQVPREKAGSTPPAERPAVTYGDPGFVWEGPVRPDAKPEPAAAPRQ